MAVFERTGPLMIGQLVRVTRLTIGLTQQDWAGRTYPHRVTINRLETGNLDPQLPNGLVFAWAIEMPTAGFLG